MPVQDLQDLQRISGLNALNNKKNLSAEECREQGFVSWFYDVDLLQKMHQFAPSIVCKEGDELAGYALTAPLESAAVHPELDLLIKKIGGILYEGVPLLEHRIYIMGQLCVAHAFRGKGVVELMYNEHRRLFSPVYDLMVLTVATANTRSVRVHERIGFQTIQKIEDHFGDWVVMVWDWKKG